MNARALWVAGLLFLLLTAAPGRAAGDGDRDDDGVLDWLDNCLEHPNPYQRDTDGDGFGNACDPDFDQNGIVDSRDQRMLVHRFVFEPHGESDNHVREGHPPEPGHPGGGVWDRYDEEMAEHLDLNSDGLVDPRDLKILLSFRGKPPGPRMDSDGDGVADLDDPCRATPEGALQVAPGCSALDIVEDPFLLVGPIVESIEGTVEALRAGGGLTPPVLTIMQDLQTTVDVLTDGAWTTRAGDPCAGARLIDAGEGQLVATTMDFEPVIEDLYASMPRHRDLGDHFVESEPARLMELRHEEVMEARDAAAVARDAVQGACDAAVPMSGSSSRILRVDDALGRIHLEDGRQIAMTLPVARQGVLKEGLSAEWGGLDFVDGTGVADALAGEPTLGRVPQLQCIRLRIVPVQKLPPFSDGPFEMHDPEGYEQYGLLQVEHGTGFAAESTCPPSRDRRYSLALKMDYHLKNGWQQFGHPIAPDLTPGDDPVVLPSTISDAFPAVLEVTTHVQDCTGGICAAPEVADVETFYLVVRDRNHFCTAHYAATRFDINDQVMGDWRQTWVTGLSLAYGVPATQFEAEGYEMCPDGSGGWQSCHPQISNIYMNHSFVLHNFDFHPVIQGSGIQGMLQAIFAKAVSGVDHAAGLRWPRARGTRNGHPFRYSCQLPEVVRDIVNFCPGGTDAMYRLPFGEGDTSFIQSQGNVPGCCGDPWSWDCCTSHNFSYAYDMGAPCDAVLRAARAGRVHKVVEHHFQQVYDNCTDGECPVTNCCPDTSCKANYVEIRHQDGSLARYIHNRLLGVFPKKGDRVRRGEKIALVGNIGPSSGPHLHFEVRDDPDPGSPPFGTVLVLFEALHPTTGNVMTCFEPPNSPSSSDPLRNLRSNNQPWP